ncbi:hypothetical protein Cpha266_0212 [Chlorobium phaeobacteroides DSM 266]|uniref:Uncharacterized protein n=1 Tax=Chlorobium phaeobacteroides (strain DSM 266 / SMG 266 / 2430) TaxID=290317 RepID=A1BD02_CHLPD|nr:hypothetical protein Cpha266_0212 [Chlorobium phaeobacteroides DSM 266]
MLVIGLFNWVFRHLSLFFSANRTLVVFRFVGGPVFFGLWRLKELSPFAPRSAPGNYERCFYVLKLLTYFFFDGYLKIKNERMVYGSTKWMMR